METERNDDPFGVLEGEILDVPSPDSTPWRAQEGPQLQAIQYHDVEEMFYGGAVGGGKSDFLLGDYGQDVAEYGPAWKGILFRKSYPQLEELIQRSMQIFPAWFPGCSVSKNYRSSASAGGPGWFLPNGASLKFRHAENDNSWTNYQGHAYPWIGYDELPHWAVPKFYQELKTRLRSAVSIPNKRIRATGNPGGLGHGWIKQYWEIARHPLGMVRIPADQFGGERMFVPAKVSDNKILMANDPGYIARLMALGDPALVQMYLDGDWNVIAGAFFSEFSVHRHLVRPFEIPKNWLRIRAMDWGSATPFCVLWAAVSEGDVPGIPRGALVVYREWYGAKPRTVNVGLKMTAEEVAARIRVLERGEEMATAVLDPSAFNQISGPSVAERMAARPHSVNFSPADNTRMVGWDAVRQRLKGSLEEGGPAMIYFFTTCTETIRTLPALQHDMGKRRGAMEDVDTQGEDHAGDTVRYLCMARPWTRAIVEPVEPPKFGVVGTAGGMQIPSFNEIVGARTRARRERENR